MFGEMALARLPETPLDPSFPIPRTRLIGRENERAAARALVLDEGVALLTLTGPGGVGRTRQALAVAAALADSFANSVAWVDLAPSPTRHSFPMLSRARSDLRRHPVRLSRRPWPVPAHASDAAAAR
ncbi:MAG: hypothetical protein M3Q50_11455 [Chloroflexota bacterium]|nr:hypothetical protein [Chloroflexota bacterium]